ncbi:mitochondrial ribosomal protein [Xylariomycetidae sp. FL0641]|nr:mitochondrial ribosomal protein [Xylariomycetidae sp. FL0641]
MGGLRRTRPGRVYQTVTAQLKIPLLVRIAPKKPVWYEAVQLIPPAETLTRPLPPQHKAPNPRARKPSRMFQPQQLVYEEDGLRRTFYKDHPWELARPRMIIEMDGKDAQRYDWSKGLQQPGMPLCGESVVQRQLWVMHNTPGITKEQAYDEVRREFYALRQQEEIERRIAKEEAQMVGAYFGKTFLQVGGELEEKQFEYWKKWAGKQIDMVTAEKSAAYTSFGSNEDEIDADDIDDQTATAADPQPGHAGELNPVAAQVPGR